MESSETRKLRKEVVPGRPPQQRESDLAWTSWINSFHSYHLAPFFFLLPLPTHATPEHFCEKKKEVGFGIDVSLRIISQ
jgi:hypothetical protein